MGKAPLFVRPPTDAERQALEDGLRASDAFVLRRAQIILASAQGEQVGVIAPHSSARAIVACTKGPCAYLALEGSIRAVEWSPLV